MGKLLLLFFSGFLAVQGRGVAQQPTGPVSDSAKGDLSLRVLPQNFYNQHLSFFCKKEVQLQKLTSLPVYFRLGSKEYVDYLERKPNSGWRPK